MPILRFTIQEVGNRSPKGFHPTIASASADNEFILCWLLGLPIPKIGLSALFPADD
ncbi:MAG: hypothetical protein LBU34_03340 [Planctomycetaceae bacterium]|nr:hypothetical protein [Planctomycetaceae bacterium]